MKPFDAWPPAQQKAHASRVLAKSGIRLMNLGGNLTVGIWSDLDSQELRWALAVFGSGDAPWKYLDGPGIPERYKLRGVAGDPVDPDVLAVMLTAAEKPWEVRDLMLASRTSAKSWDEWMKAQRNRIFRENAEERERKYAGMDVAARERIAIAEEEATHAPDRERKRELTVIQKNWKMYMRWYQEQPREAARWRRAHQDSHGQDNWLRNPELPWSKKREELWEAADRWQHEHPEWPHE